MAGFEVIIYGRIWVITEDACRIYAPSAPVRASAEHWLMREYLGSRERLPHASLAPDKDGRTFSMHVYIDREGTEKSIFFETTESFGREEDDFRQFLLENPGDGERPDHRNGLCEQHRDLA